MSPCVGGGPATAGVLNKGNTAPYLYAGRQSRCRCEGAMGLSREPQAASAAVPVPEVAATPATAAAATAATLATNMRRFMRALAS